MATAQRSTPRLSPASRKTMIWALLVPLLAVGGYFLWQNPEWIVGEAEASSAYVTDVARRGPLRIVVTERGQLDSDSNVTLASQVEGSSTIISIVAEGYKASAPVLSTLTGEVTAISEPSPKVKEIVVTGPDGDQVPHSVPLGEHTRIRVEVGDTIDEGAPLAGDLLCELDSSELREEHKEQVIKFKQAEADLVKSEANVNIQTKQNESDMAAARLAKRLAELDLEKFEKGESIQQQNEVRGEMTLAKEELTRAREVFDFTKRLARKGYKSLNDLEADRIAVTKAEIGLSVADDKLGVMQDYTYIRTIEELREMETEAGRALDRTKVSGEAALKAFEAELEARQLAHEVEQTKLNRLEAQVDASMMYAPQDGIVVYANESGRRGSDSVVIEEGATVRERQRVINLPDLARMKVSSKIHESRISLLDKSAAFAELDSDGNGYLTEGEVLPWMWAPLLREDANTDNRISPNEFAFPATLKIDAFPGETFTGIVGSVASVASSGDWMRPDLKQYATEIGVVDFRGRELKPGMNAVVEIVVKQREDVLQIPVQSVVTIGSKRYAWVLEGANPVRRDITVKDTSGTNVEVVTGVKEGENVLMNPRTHFAKEIEELQAAGKKGGGDAKAGAKGGKGRPGKKP